jgi:sigma-B regulation protein RsbU (phosphoserine phosphatase)
METLPPVILGVVIFLSFLAVLALRKPFESFVVLQATATSQPKRQLFMDLALCLVAGIIANAFNIIYFGFPFVSGIWLTIGCAVIGFFLSLDTALARERDVINNAVAQDHVLPLPGRLYSMTKKFSLVALTTTIFVSLVITLVFSRDIVWLSKIELNESALYQAQLSVAYEVFFILLVLLALVTNLIISYSRNLRLLFKNETGILERVTQGDLSHKVPVVTKDEFGVIAGHTNDMIDGLRHRTEMIGALKLAEEVQQNLLPQHAPKMPGLDVVGTSIYCNETGGDYYDYFRLPHDKLGIVVADASGHGVGAAMHMTTVRAFLHFGMQNYQTPSSLLNDVNYYATRDSSNTSRFMSMFFLEIDPTAKMLRWVRAGHEPAMVFGPEGEKLKELSGNGMALGVVEDYTYSDYTLHGWEPGTIIIIGTDGIHEARAENDEMFGLDRLFTIIHSNAAKPAQVIQDAVIDALHSFQGDVPQEDDITLVIVKMLD